MTRTKLNRWVTWVAELLLFMLVTSLRLHIAFVDVPEVGTAIVIVLRSIVTVSEIFIKVIIKVITITFRKSPSSHRSRSWC